MGSSTDVQLVQFDENGAGFSFSKVNSEEAIQPHQLWPEQVPLDPPVSGPPNTHTQAPTGVLGFVFVIIKSCVSCLYTFKTLLQCLDHMMEQSSKLK